MGVPLRALIVEDSPDDAALISAELQRGGFDLEYERVDTAEAMIQALERHNWDVITCDYHMPRFTTDEALRLAQQSGQDIAFIVVSGKVGEETAVGLMKAGAHDYIMKDSMARLCPAVRREITAAVERRTRGEAQHALRASEARLRAIVNIVPEGVWETDASGNTVLVNNALTKMLGFSADEMLGRPLSDFVDPELRREADWFRERRKQGIKEEHEIRLRRKDGSDLWTIIKTAAIFDEGGQFTEAVDLVTEIKTREQLEEQLARIAEDFQRFAYAASHDLQEPVRMVGSYVQLLACRYKGKLDSDADEFIHFAMDGAERLQAMIMGLLDFSRVQSRGKPAESTSCEATFEQAMRDMRAAIEESGAVVTHDPLPTISYDDVQLSRLFQNLIDNAIKFRRDEPPHVHISAEQQGGQWVFSVQDNGMGIAQEQSTRIFNIFDRLHSREEYPGIGMGLAVCKRIVERHGGRIWVESESGRGSTFYFTVPCAPSTVR